ncbi:hypothetical protein Lalb_Chr10g0106511 [Lupinus albus]|uniref:Uncharacterized protein n=1 Tax=Lupinus albus TaxID=3870 RepID=A0A6A4PXP8_LUPAL|nr:hypothetical protein Lalb_Chr10g0106511 [Lupinus albus]
MEGDGATLSEIYQRARKLLLRTRDGLERVERGELSFSDSVHNDISQIQSLYVQMDRLWRSIPIKSQRDLWKRLISLLFLSFFSFSFSSPFSPCITMK